MSDMKHQEIATLRDKLKAAMKIIEAFNVLNDSPRATEMLAAYRAQDDALHPPKDAR